MELLINIPKEFEQHFQADRFEDSLHRLRADMHLMAGLYEQETAEMLIEAFKNAVLVPPHGRLIDADALEQDAQKRMLMCNKNDNQFQKPYEVMRAISLAPTVIEAEENEQ